MNKIPSASSQSFPLTRSMTNLHFLGVHLTLIAFAVALVTTGFTTFGCSFFSSLTAFGFLVRFAGALTSSTVSVATVSSALTSSAAAFLVVFALVVVDFLAVVFLGAFTLASVSTVSTVYVVFFVSAIIYPPNYFLIPAAFIAAALSSALLPK